LALPPMNISDESFVREVDEELQRDQLLTLWQRYGRWAVAAIVLGLVAWGGWLYWSHLQMQEAALEGEKYVEVLDGLQAGSDLGADAKLAALAKSERPGYRASAAITRAAIQYQSGDRKKAIDGFAAIASDASVAQPWRDLALVRQTAAEFDTLKPDVIIARLKPLAISGNPWFGSAGEMTAIAYLRMGKNDLAGKLFADLGKAQEVPDSIRSRSVQMANALGVAVAKPVTKEVAP
jgi:hypothetical protein